MYFYNSGGLKSKMVLTGLKIKVATGWYLLKILGEDLFACLCSFYRSPAFFGAGPCFSTFKPALSGQVLLMLPFLLFSLSSASLYHL